MAEAISNRFFFYSMPSHMDHSNCIQDCDSLFPLLFYAFNQFQQEQFPKVRFEASDDTLIHGLQDRRRVGRKEDKFDVFKVCEARVGWAIIDEQKDFSSFHAKFSIPIPEIGFENFRCHPCPLVRSIVNGKVLHVFKAPWLLRFSNH